ncbi:MAG TPA: response regulator transcription factor [Solirubrobacteraceae bacterium]|nr:response regulator transcription factor [Solirubrobacteraceae bacterium]
MVLTTRTRVVIADDHPLFRDGLARRIKERPELELIGEAADGPTALETIRELRPDVAVLDIKMPRLDGLRVAAALAREELPTKVVMLSAYVESAIVFKALAAGARAFLSKDSDRRDVCDAIGAVARGEVVVPPTLQPGLVEQIRAHAGGDEPNLTTRERQVLSLVADGASAPQIGRQLHLSTGTVKTHLKSLYEKLGVNDRAAAVAEAMRRGMLE